LTHFCANKFQHSDKNACTLKP